mgnify:CR=1 FL=1
MTVQNTVVKANIAIEMIEHSLSDDLSNSAVILEKVKDNRYAQNLYAAMCNMQWQKSEAWPILKEELWACTWRSAGEIVAELQGQGNYIDWYCSGMSWDYDADDKIGRAHV